MTTPEAMTEALSAIEEEAGNLWHFVSDAEIPEDLRRSLERKVQIIWNIARHGYDFRTPQDKGE